MDVVGYALANTARATPGTPQFLPYFEVPRNATGAAAPVSMDPTTGEVYYQQTGNSIFTRKRVIMAPDISQPQGGTEVQDSLAASPAAPNSGSGCFRIVPGTGSKEHWASVYSSTGGGYLLWKYDVTGNVWTTKTSPGTAAQEGGFVWHESRDEFYADVSGWKAYDPANNIWTAKAVASGMSRFAYCPDDGLIYGSEGTTHSAFDATANTWTVKAAAPIFRRYHVMGSPKGVGRIVHIGGEWNHPSGYPYGFIRLNGIYNITTNTWEPGPNNIIPYTYNQSVENGHAGVFENSVFHLAGKSYYNGNGVSPQESPGVNFPMVTTKNNSLLAYLASK